MTALRSRYPARAEGATTDVELVHRALAYGLGVEDISVVHGIPEGRTRKLIATWRERGTLLAIIRGQA